MNLARRIAQLENTETMTRDNRLVLRFEGPGSEGFPEPTQGDRDRDTEILTVHFVEGKGWAAGLGESNGSNQRQNSQA